MFQDPDLFLLGVYYCDLMLGSKRQFPVKSQFSFPDNDTFFLSRGGGATCINQPQSV